MTTYRWLTDIEIDEWVNPECVRKGWMRFNINEQLPTCRVLGAFEGPEMVGFFGFSLLPFMGPMFADSMHRDGKVSRGLAEKMHEFMNEIQCRGAIMIADEPTTERFAERHGLEQVKNPVFIWKPEGN